MRFSMASAKIWKEVVNAIEALTDEVVFLATPDGIGAKAMDASRVAMVVVNMPAFAFEEYECHKEETFAVNLFDLKKIMKRAGAGDKITVSTAMGRLSVVMESPRARRSFYTRLLDLESTDFSEPTVDLTVSAKLVPSALKEAIRDASIMGDYATFKSDGDALYIGSASAAGSVKTDINEDLLEIEVKEPSEATYNLSFLEDMMRAAAVCSTVKVEFATNLPLKLEYNIIGGGTLTYWLAPWIQTE